VQKMFDLVQVRRFSLRENEVQSLVAGRQSFASGTSSHPSVGAATSLKMV
jgi:hypothetical protein